MDRAIQLHGAIVGGFETGLSPWQGPERLELAFPQALQRRADAMLIIKATTVVLKKNANTQ